MPKAVMEDWLAPSRQTWEHDGVSWHVVLRWAEIDGYAECVAMEIYSDDPVQILRAEPVHSLPLGRLVRGARRERYERTAGPAVNSLAGSDDEFQFTRGEVAEARAWGIKAERRRPQLDQAHYAAVARVYSNAVIRKSTPRKAVAEVMHVSEPTASRWIAEARARGLLPPTTPGRPRGAAAIDEEEK